MAAVHQIAWNMCFGLFLWRHLCPSEDIWNCFKSRAGIPTPHCFTFIQGKNLPQKYTVLLTDAVQQDATYCCVKSFVRDTMLQQPPLILSPAGRVSAIATHLPTQLLAKREMTEDEIKNYLKLAALCNVKYGMPRASEALKKMIYSRDYGSCSHSLPLMGSPIVSHWVTMCIFHICQTALGKCALVCPEVMKFCSSAVICRTQRRWGEKVPTLVVDCQWLEVSVSEERMQMPNCSKWYIIIIVLYLFLASALAPNSFLACFALLQSCGFAIVHFACFNAADFAGPTMLVWFRLKQDQAHGCVMFCMSSMYMSFCNG